MELFIGFLLGIVASIIASFVFKVFESALPLSKQKHFLGFLKNPSLFMRIRFNTEEKKIKELIVKLFNAWEKKDLKEYLSCWSDDAIRVVGTNSSTKEDKETIRTKFTNAVEKYSNIKVDALVLDEISFGPRPGTAVATVHYRFCLFRSEDGLPVIEDAQEVYSVRKANDGWIIASNIDHFYEIGSHLAT